MLQRFRHLALPEKLELLELLWDDLASHPEQIPLSEKQRALLGERLRQHEENHTMADRIRCGMLNVM